MNNNKQSSVEWLFEELFNSFEKFSNGDISFAEYLAHNLTLREQAQVVHKEEIKNAFSSGEHQQGFEGETEQYYNETFNTKEK